MTSCSDADTVVNNNTYIVLRKAIEYKAHVQTFSEASVIQSLPVMQ